MKKSKNEKLLIKSMRDAIGFFEGKKIKAKIHASAPDVAKTRKKLGLSQNEFANAFGVSAATVKNWEQGRRQPEGPAKVLLAVIQKHPNIVFDSLR